MKKTVGIILTIMICAALLAGCSLGNAASAAPTVITSGQSAAAEDEPRASVPAATPGPTPSPTPEPVTDIPQLQSKDGFMEAQSLEGIDPLNDKVIALTFDDGPNPVKTPELLDVLKENGVVATFFVVGNLVEQYPDVVKREYEEGHEIGTHSYTHPEKTWSTLSADEILAQYTQANDAIETATGLRTLFDRPVGGGMSEETAVKIGREQIIWSVDPEDWKYKDADAVYEHVMNGWNGGAVQDGAVILSHEIYQSTVDAYARIIPELKEKGYKFVTVSQMMQIAEIRGESLDYLFKSAPAAGKTAGEE